MIFFFLMVVEFSFIFLFYFLFWNLGISFFFFFLFFAQIAGNLLLDLWLVTWTFVYTKFTTGGINCNMPVHASNNTVNNTKTNNVKGNYLMLFFIFQFKVSASPNVPNQPYETTRRH